MRLIKIPSVLLFLLLFLNSCVNDLNFDDTDLGTSPVITTPLVNFTLDQNDFFNPASSTEITEIELTVGDFNILQSDGAQSNLTRIEFDFEIRNDFDRTITSVVDFLDGNDDVTYSIDPIIVSANNANSIFISISVTRNPDLLRSKKIRVNLRLSSSGPSIDPDTPSEFDFKSVGTYYLSL